MILDPDPQAMGHHATVSTESTTEASGCIEPIELCRTMSDRMVLHPYQYPS